jgi:predicted DNA-binding protein with PD1-like motif
MRSGIVIGGHLVEGVAHPCLELPMGEPQRDRLHLRAVVLPQTDAGERERRKRDDGNKVEAQPFHRWSSNRVAMRSLSNCRR